jgi:hypothetical protein
MEYKFSDLQPDIFEAVKKLDDAHYFGTGKTLTIVEGFLNVPVQSTIGGGVEMGQFAPMIAVMDVNSGQIWQFALTILLPKVKLN